MTGDSLKTKDVFGIQRDLPLNYVEREADKVLLNSLDRKHHVVIYGSSKQGKTSLRKRNLKEQDYVIVHCSNKWDLLQINLNILKQAGFELTTSEKITTSGKAKVKATFGWNLFAKAQAEPEIEGCRSKEREIKALDIDPEDVNDIITALEALDFKRIIVLEDFHYLKPETQKDFSIALKAFHENSSFTFLIIGVWLEENRLIALNGDLAGRVKSVNADEWQPEELHKVINDGEYLLNVRFDQHSKDTLVKECLQNVYIVQEVCYEICRRDLIEETVQGQTVELNCKELELIIDGVIDQHAGRYNTFVTSFVDGFQATELEMYKWIFYSVISAPIDQLEKGLRRSEIATKIQEKHPKGSDLNPGNLTQALKSIAALQIKKGITPIILDYDSGNLRLNIVDKGFIIWLNN